MKLKLKSLLVLIIATLLFIVSCGKDDNPTTPPDEQNTTGTYTDSRDNQTYSWVKIGDQIWMSENLAYKTKSGEYWAYNNDTNNIPIYGYLYSWEIAQTIAPQGWHLPSQAEWLTLVDYLGGSQKAYDKLLEAGTLHWKSPNSATNESGFTALPSGYFDKRDNSFNSLGDLTMFHSTTEAPGNSTFAMGLILNPNYKASNIEGRPKMLALPIRCIKD